MSDQEKKDGWVFGAPIQPVWEQEYDEKGNPLKPWPEELPVQKDEKGVVKAGAVFEEPPPQRKSPGAKRVQEARFGTVAPVAAGTAFGRPGDEQGISKAAFNCPRCGQRHYDRPIVQLVRSTSRCTHWAWCPVENQPVLIAFEVKIAEDPALESPGFGKVNDPFAVGGFPGNTIKFNTVTTERVPLGWHELLLPWTWFRRTYEVTFHFTVEPSEAKE